MENIPSQSQESVWNSIAPEWHGFKTSPSQHVIEFLENKSGNILDHGSGSGRHLIAFPKNFKGKIFLVDFSSEMIKFAKKRAKESKIKEIQFDVSDLSKLPYEDNFFDSVFSIAAIHCIKPEFHDKVVSEIYRILKPKSEALIEVWNKESNRFKKHPSKEKNVGWRDKGKRFYYLFDEKEIFNLFEKHNLKIIKKLDHGVNISFIVKK